MKCTAKFFKVLSDEARLEMLWLLFNQKELCVCDFVAASGITQSKASRHLRALWHEGLVIDRKDGLWSYYSLRPLESALTRPHLKLLRATLAGCPEASVVLERLEAWLASNRTMSMPPRSRARPPRAGAKTIKRKAVGS